MGRFDAGDRARIARLLGGESLRRMYDGERMTVGEIARAVGVSGPTVARAMDAAGIRRRRGGASRLAGEGGAR